MRILSNDLDYTRKLLLLLASSLFPSTVMGQSLFLASQDSSENESAQPTILLEEVSLHFIPEPDVRVIQKHDIITIIIDENSTTTSSQSLDTKKDTKSDATVSALVDWLQLLELRLEEGVTSDRDLLSLATKRSFKGEGDYERKDKFSARITAQVLEVKPNGTLVLQATKSIARDSETSMLVLSGLAREEDITAQNTVLSSQLADLTINLQNEGDLKEAAEKGLITRVLDSVFAF